MAAGGVDLPAHWARLDGPAAGASVLVRALTLTLRCLRLGSTDIDGREPALPRRFPVQAPSRGLRRVASAICLSLDRQQRHVCVDRRGSNQPNVSFGPVCRLPDLMSLSSWLRLGANSMNAFHSGQDTRRNLRAH